MSNDRCWVFPWVSRTGVAALRRATHQVASGETKARRVSGDAHGGRAARNAVQGHLQSRSTRE